MVAMAVAGCGVDRTPYTNGRHNQPLSDEMLGEIENRNIATQSAILMRIFKEESELEVWKEDKTGRFALLRTYNKLLMSSQARLPHSRTLNCCPGARPQTQEIPRRPRT
jgi:murein L,D-transpeptidase YafK